MELRVERNPNAPVCRTQARGKKGEPLSAVQCEEPVSCSRMSRSTCSSVLSDCADGYGDGADDRRPSSHLGTGRSSGLKIGGLPGRIKQVSNSSNYSHI